jgi:predicted alpha/beta-hydrolase family hydrolase
VADPLILFAPGAGAPSTSDWMLAWARRLSTLGTVRAFDYPYRREGRRAPDRLPVLIAAHREALRDARAGHAGPVFLAGKSMGGRIGCHAALEEDVDGLVCFGYPLRAAGAKGALRDEVLKALSTPILFVQGTRDPLCPLDTLEAVRGQMTAPQALHVVDGGDHSLVLRKGDLARQGRTQDDVDGGILKAVAAFIAAPDRG